MTQELLFKLIDALGPSGREQEVRSLILKEIRKYVDATDVDGFGNIIAFKKGKNDVKIMLAAHMDEIGLMIKEIQRDGMIRFTPIGGIEPMTLLGQPVSILSKKTKACGVITIKDIDNGEYVESLPKMNELYVDIGAASREQVLRLGISTGDYIIPNHTTSCLANKRRFSGKAVDNRVGCYALIQLIKRLKKCPYDMYFVFTVQEEIGLYGAKIATYKIEPDWGIAVDSTNADEANDDPNIVLGKGPVLTYMDSEIISNSCLNDWLEQTAKKKKIKMQKKVEEGGSTDAARIMISKKGVPSTTVSIPVRNMHSTVGIADIVDIENTVDLLYWFFQQKLQKCVV